MKTNYKKMRLPPWIGFKIGNWLSLKLTRFIEKNIPPDIRLIEMSSAYEQAQCLYVAAKLNIADHLANNPNTASCLKKQDLL